MIPLTAEEAGRVLGLAPLAAAVQSISIDSRSIRPGDLFIALRGERFDGHDFVEAALAGGGWGAVVERGTWAGRAKNEEKVAWGGPIYEVEDTLRALGALAGQVRRESSAKVLAITGSVGKTSTKDVLAAMVGRVRRVVATCANQNNEVGVPLTLFRLERDTEAVVVEMGMRGYGEIATLARIAEPDVGVITNIHPVHLESLGSLEGVAKAKAELIAGLRVSGTAVVPHGCSLLRPFTAAARCRVIHFGVGPDAGGADVRGTLETVGDGGTYVLTLRWPDGEAQVETEYLPRHALENVVAGVAACHAAGLPVEECVAGLLDARISAARGEVKRLPGLSVIDDTYNASPAAVRAALDVLVRLAGEMKGRAVAVLGDMMELGIESQRFHEEVGAYAAALGVTALWGVGPRSHSTVEGFRRRWRAAGGAAAQWTAGHVGSAEETSTVMDGLRRGDVALFKASRRMKFETLVRRVVEEAEAGRWAPGNEVAADRASAAEETRRC